MSPTRRFAAVVEIVQKGPWECDRKPSRDASGRLPRKDRQDHRRDSSLGKPLLDFGCDRNQSIEIEANLGLNSCRSIGELGPEISKHRRRLGVVIQCDRDLYPRELIPENRHQLANLGGLGGFGGFGGGRGRF